MGRKTKGSLIAWAVLTTLTACVDGGPPSPFRRPSMRDAPSTAADGGSARDDAAVNDDADAGPTLDGALKN
jgi:hypothetical protein